MYKVESGIQPIEKLISANKKVKYPFKDMLVGDSFEITESEKEKVRTACFNFGSRNKKIFRIGSDSSGALRCWRLE